ncbi:hypothetical protein RHGRI_031406 [Rhododendron griersonianum]|uniref:Uncharacterized protein n=1 Tax=Rhododendron griersonianum TaxID=479676 RepID=A0AAV6I857_9ERIC|nr:hypothetical protein RHGRI_031406 [Rhododendron griersonianum]
MYGGGGIPVVKRWTTVVMLGVVIYGGTRLVFSATTGGGDGEMVRSGRRGEELIGGGDGRLVVVPRSVVMRILDEAHPTPLFPPISTPPNRK